MMVKHNRSWTLTTQKTTASELDDLMDKGMSFLFPKLQETLTLLKEEWMYSLISLIIDKHKFSLKTFCLPRLKVLSVYYKMITYLG